LTAVSTVSLILVSSMLTYISNKSSVTQLVEYPHYVFYLFRLLSVVQLQHIFMIIIYYRKNNNLRKTVAEQIRVIWRAWSCTSETWPQLTED